MTGSSDTTPEALLEQAATLIGKLKARLMNLPDEPSTEGPPTDHQFIEGIMVQLYRMLDEAGQPSNNSVSDEFRMKISLILQDAMIKLAQCRR